MYRIERPASCLVTSGSATDHDAASRERVLEAVRLGVKNSVSLIQIREKCLSAHELYRLVGSAVEITRASKTRLLVNDRADIAAAAGADGVQLRADSMGADVVRKAFPQLLIGCSVHTADDADETAAAGADFVMFGPVFETPGKSAVGIAKLADVCRRVPPLPVIAIGGIDAGTAAQVIDAGAAGVAAIRAMSEPESLTALMRSLQT